MASPEGYVSESGEPGVAPNRVMVDTAYFHAMGIPLMKGRLFDERDTTNSMRVVIVDPVLAERFWPGEDPLGKRMYYGVDVTESTRFFTVVGVVGRHAMRGLEDLVGAVGAYFVPDAQSELPVTQLTFTIRTMGDPHGTVNGVRAEVTELDADLPLFDVNTLEERIGDSLKPRRTPMLLSVGFALLALLLSALGTHGLLAYRVARRSKEFGIRLALGSTPAKLCTLMLSEGVTVVGLGLTVGTVGAIVLRDRIASQLYQTSSFDQVLVATAIVILAVVALLASALSAKRAAHVDPVSMLNYE